MLRGVNSPLSTAVQQIQGDEIGRVGSLVTIFLMQIALKNYCGCVLQAWWRMQRRHHHVVNVAI